MNLFVDALAWIFSPDKGASVVPIPTALVQHLVYTAISVLIAAAVAVLVGVFNWFERRVA